MLSRVCPDAQFKLYEDTQSGGFSGYASTFGNYDRVGEAVAPGAFSNLDDFVKSGFIAVGHDWEDLPVATITEAKTDAYGLWIRADFHSTDCAQEARMVLAERLARGKFCGLSIGYEVMGSEQTQDGRLLTDLTLYEVSLVTVPANPLAGVSAAKHAPPAGLSLDDHADLVLAHAKDLADRLRALHELRAKDRRSLSAARRDDLLALKALVDDLSALTAPRANPDLARAAYARLLASSTTTR